MIETERLLIRACHVDDIPAYAEIVADPDVMQYIGPGTTLTYALAEKSILLNIQQFEKSGWSRFVVVDKETDELMGFCGFADYNNELDFGWRYSRKSWGKGYGTEAAAAVLELGVEKFKFPRIVCIAHFNNIGSIKIIEKIGMDYEKDIEIDEKPIHQYVKLLPNS